jgi:hypothetical protein
LGSNCEPFDKPVKSSELRNLISCCISYAARGRVWVYYAKWLRARTDRLWRL